MNIPTREECLEILKGSNVPENIVEHMRAVHDFSMKIVDLLEKKGTHANRSLVATAALLHDVKKISSEDHVTEGYVFIKSLGFPEVALVIKKHSLVNLQNDEFVPKTWEEKIIFYADKRLNGSKVVSVDERFEYARKRYSIGVIEEEFRLTKKIEEELLGNEKIG